MDNEKLSNLRQRWRRNGREIRGIVATLAVLVVALGTAVSLFLAAFTQTRPTYCGQKHEHTAACYSNPKADVETAKKWEKTLPASEEETPRITKLVDVVRSQVGYSESKDNYAVEGDELRGYTRYGAWDGDPYEPWNATFVNFCLHYAGIDAGMFAPKSADDSQEDAKDAQDESGDAVEEVAAEDGANEEASQEQDLVLEQASATEDYDVPQDDDPLAGANQDADLGEDTSWYADVQWDDEDQSTDDNAANNVADDTSLTDNVSWDDESQDTENSDDAGASDAGASDAGEAQQDDDADKATEQQKAPRTAEEWKQRLSDAGLYVAASDAKPQAGDLVFLQEPADEAAASKNGNRAESQTKQKKTDDQDAESSQEIEISADDVAGVESDDKDKSQPENKPLRVAIVTDVNNKKGLVRIAEGDASDEVDETWYPASDPEIVGYGTMPSELRDELAAYKKLVAERKAAEEEAAKKAAEEEAARKAEEEAARKAAEEAAKKAAAEEEAARKAVEEEAAKLEAELMEVPQVLTAEADGFRISANLAGQAQEGYTLQVKPLKATKKRLAAVEEGLTQELPDGATKQAHVDADDVVLFDISIRDKDGNEVELGKKVRIAVTPLEDANQQASAESAASDQTPEVVHLATEGTEVLNAKPKDEGFSFATKSLSPFAFVFTVDFEYQGYTWSMAGESSALLSTVLSELNVSDFSIDDVTDVTFSNPELVDVALQEQDGQRDWLLVSLKPFTTSEKLTLALTDGSAVVIDVTDTANDDAMAKAYDDPQHIRRRLARVEFYDGNALVGDSDNTSESMVVRPGHEYTMRLHFSENENVSGDAGQLPDSGIMYYDIPSNVHISLKAFDENHQVKFDIVLDRKHTLADNVVTYVPANGNVPAYLMVEWNTTDTENYKRLKASPRTTFMLSFPYTTVDADNVNEIFFSDSIKLNVEKDQTYDVELEKEYAHDETDPSMITYTVTATALGDVKNVVLTDTMGEALTYQYDKQEGADPGVSVTYKDSEGNSTSYDNSNIGAVTQSDRGFSLQLNSLKGGDKAIFTYRAKVDFAKLGGQDNIEITSRNTVTAKNQQGEELDQTYQVLEDIVNYLQIGKARNSVEYYEHDETTNTDIKITDTEHPGEQQDHYVANHWDYMSVKWTVIYNPDGKIDVEGATISDKVWKGAKNVTTYDQTKPLTITAYSSVDYTKGDAGANDSFTLKDGCETVVLVDGTGEHNGWDALDEVADYLDDAHLSTWSWTIPPKDGTDRKENNHYTYVITYYTKVLNDANRKSGYVGNQASESIADITRDKSVEFPGIGPDYDVEIDKKYLQDDYVTETVRDPDTGKTKTVTNVYTQWEVTFDRRASGQDRALVEDTLPHTEINGVVYTDTFESAGYVEANDWSTYKHGNYAETTQNGKTTSNHGWEVEGLKDSEICIPRVSADQYDVVFWFYTHYTGNKDDLNNSEGLLASTIRTDENNNEQHDPIKIKFWTKNNNTWIQSTAEGRAPSEHWNYVHLILNGKEAIDKEFAIPKPTPEITKTHVQAGTWTPTYDSGADAPNAGITLPVYRYTLAINGLSDDLFKEVDGKRQLVITDTFDASLDYIPLESVSPDAMSTNVTVNIGTESEPVNETRVVTFDSRSKSDEKLHQVSPAITDETAVSEWDAKFSGGDNTTVATEPVAKAMGKGDTKTITIAIDYDEAMKHEVRDDTGKPYASEKVFGSTYEVSYYLALDHAEVKRVAQEMINTEKEDPANFDYSNTATSRSLSNIAKVTSYEGTAFSNEADWTFAYNLNPVQKQLLSYDSSSELATYKIEINPLKVKVNNGERYSVQDSYTNMAVDFQTVNIVTEPASARKDVEWSYHSNKGTFWVPDETKVTITYEGWPVGKRDNDDLTFSNTASIGGYESEVEHKTKLDVEHSGYASSYRVRVFKFEDDNMDKTLPGAVFQLFEEGEDGKPAAMKYGVSSGVSEENNNNSFGAWNASDDSEWQSVTWEKANTAGILHYTTPTDQASEANSFIPTPERHYEGDNIYFITGNGGNANGKSEQSGFAEIMLSQSRDGLSLKKNKQYYLREVLVPDEHYKEDIDWRFIIGDADDYDNYVYADDSVMQVSNASVDRVLTVHKDFIDLTSGGKITDDKGSINYDLIKNTEFEIVGTDKGDSSKVVYRKVVPYSSFMAVYTPIEGSTKSKREYLLIIHDLPEGNYTVKELRTSGLIKDANGQLVDGIRLTTSVEDAKATTTKVVKEGGQVLETTSAFKEEHDGGSAEDSYFKFEVTKAEDTIAGTVTKTAAEATFTNIYTDNPPITLSLTKEWSNGGKSGFAPKKAEFALYADGVKYNLTEYNGVSAPGSINPSGNIVLTVGDNAESPWTTTASITNLPMYKDGSIEHKIAWTVKEVSATYNMGGNTSDITVDAAQNDLLNEHFLVTANTDTPTSDRRYSFNFGDQSSEQGSATLTNTLNKLITVEVVKSWADGNENHDNDSVFVDIYRVTKDTIQAQADPSNPDYQSLATDVNRVIENYELNAANNWTFRNELMERFNEETNKYYQYFALERSVAGYTQSQTRSDTTDQQQITIINTKHADTQRGTLSIKKDVSGLPDGFSKTYKFTLWNSGKYMAEDGSLHADKQEISVTAGDTKTISNVKLGTYILEELEDEAQVGGYTLTLTSISAAVNGGTAVTTSGRTAEITVTENAQTTVTVANTYAQDQSSASKTKFTFGKLWAMPAADEDNPNTGDSTTLPWPNGITTTMQIRRRLANQESSNDSFVLTYEITKNSQGSLETTYKSESSTVPQGTFTTNAPALVVGTGDNVTNYNHYTFSLDGLPKYDTSGNEWVYYTQETAVVDAENRNLLNAQNGTGRQFVTSYGYVDGIGAYSVPNKQDAAANSARVECAINRIKITEAINIPVQKSINGWIDWGAGSSDDYIPSFTFMLYDSLNRVVTDDEGNPITFTSNEQGLAEFDVTPYIDLNQLYWRQYNETTKQTDETTGEVTSVTTFKQTIAGSYTFAIKEVAQASPNTLDALSPYHGVTYFNGKATITFKIDYNWMDGQLVTTARVTNESAQPVGTEGKAVITNTYDPGKAQLTVTKTWDDANNQDGYRRPVKFKVNATYKQKDGNGYVDVPINKVWTVGSGANGTKTQVPIDLNEYRITVNPGEGNTSSKTVTLPKYYEGHLISYTAQEMRSEDATLSDKYNEVPAIAKIGSKYYPSLREAVDDASAGATIELLADDTESFKTGGIIINKNLTINGNYHTVKGLTEYGIHNVTINASSPDEEFDGTGGSNAHGFFVQSGNVTIKNLNMTQFGDSDYVNKFGLVPVLTATNYNGTLKLENVDIDKFNRQAICIFGGTFQITGGTINGNGTNKDADNGKDHFQQGIEIRGGSGTINGTTVRGMGSNLGYPGIGIVSWSAGTVTLNNVDVDVDGIGIEPDAHAITITGNRTYVKGTDKALFVEDAGTLNVTEGTYIGTIAVGTATTDAGSKINVSGGEFTQKVLDTQCATGYVPSEQLADGMWTVVQAAQQTPVSQGSNQDVTVPVPTAVQGLVYNGQEQVGVEPGEGYTLTGNTATDAGSHEATATLKTGYAWADANFNGKVSWSIGRAPATVKVNDVVITTDETNPTLTCTVTGTFGNDALSYTAPSLSGTSAGAYTITASGDAVQGNYDVTYEPGKLVILPTSPGVGENAVAYAMAANGTVTSYNTVEELVSAITSTASDDCVVVHLLKNVTLNSPLHIDKKVIIDGASSTSGETYTIQPSDNYTYRTEAPKELAFIEVSGTGDLTLSNVTIDAAQKHRAIRVSGGELTLNDGAKVTNGTTATSYIGGVYMTGKSKLIMNGGEISGNTVPAYSADGYLQYTADLWIGSEAKGTMNGGKVVNLFVNSNEYAKPSAGFTQNGGEVTNAFIEYDKNQKASLTHAGGTLTNLYISQDDANTHGDKHSAVQPVTTPVLGTTYSAGSAVACIGSGESAKFYTSFEDAVNDAQTDDTITLLANATVGSMVSLSKSITVDLNGYTLSAASNTDKAFEVVGDAKLTINGTTANSAFVGRINVGKKSNNNGNLELNGGTYSCGSGQTVVHVNGTCTNSSVSIKNATITSPDDNGIQLNGAGTYVIENSSISGATAVYLKAGKLTVADSRLTSTASSHTDYTYSGSGSNPTGDAIVVDSCHYPGANPTLELGVDNQIAVSANSGNVQVGYYEYNTSQSGYAPGVVTATTSGGTAPDITLPVGYDWAKSGNGTYAISETRTVTFIYAGSLSADGKAVESQDVVIGQKASKPSDPTRTDKTFLGWYYTNASNAEVKFDFNTPITADITLTAKWEDIVTAPTSETQYTNVHVPETVNVSVTKVWDHNGKTENLPTQLKVRLVAKYGNHKTVNEDTISQDQYAAWRSTAAGTTNYSSMFDEVTLTDAGSWSKTWNNLPRFAPGEQGKQVTYTIEEVETVTIEGAKSTVSTIPVGYHQTDYVAGEQTEVANNPGTYTQADTITNTYESVSIPIQKVWQDDDDRDSKRPQNITMVLFAVAGKGTAEEESITIPSDEFVNSAGTQIAATQTLSGNKNTWSNTTAWANLPAYYHGKPITYTVAEQSVPEGYEASGDPAGTATVPEGDTNNTHSVTNTHAIERTTVSLTKTWRDNKDQDGKRPSIVEYVNTFVHFYAELGSDSTKTELKMKTDEISGESGYHYLYVALDAEQTPFVVDGMNLKAHLVESGDGRDYVITYENLPKKKNTGSGSVDIAYSVTETDDEGNVLQPGDTSTHKNLSTNSNNDTYLYHIYSTMSSATDNDGNASYAVTNEYEPDFIHVKAKKAWTFKDDLSDEQKVALGNQIQLKLVAKDGTTKIDTSTWANAQVYDHVYNVSPQQSLTRVDANTFEWQYTWVKLPKYVPGKKGQLVTYTVEEVASTIPDGYHMTATSVNTSGAEVARTETGEVEVTNTYEDVSVSAQKTWDDASNQDGLRRAVNFQLQEQVVGDDGKYGDWTPVDVSNADIVGANPQTLDQQTTDITDSVTTATWSKLPAWKKNQHVNYRVVEIPADSTNDLGAYLPGYSQTNNPAVLTYPGTAASSSPNYTLGGDTDGVITNKHTPATKNVTFIKKWDHKGASNVLTTAQFKETLHLWARVVGTNDVYEMGDSSHWDPVFATNWKSGDNTTVTEDSNGNYVVTVKNLPVNKPKSTATAGNETLEYYLTEATVPTETTGAEDINTLLGYYTQTYPTGTGHPINTTGESTAQNAQTEYLQNTRQTGNLTISKVVDSDLAGDSAIDFTFTITASPAVTGEYTVSYTDRTEDLLAENKLVFKNGTATGKIKLRNGQGITITGLPVGVTYTVQETQVTDFEIPQYSTNGGTTYTNNTSNQSYACNMTTSGGSVIFKNIRKKNDLTISKTVHSAVQGDKDHEFTFKVTLNDTSISKSYSTVKTAANGTTTGSVTFSQGVATGIQLKHGESLRIVDLPVTVGYTVEEVFNTTETSKYTAVGSQSGTINSSEASNVSFTNTRKTGTLKLTKKLLKAIPTDDGDTFYFNVTLTGDDSAALDLSDAAANISVKVNGDPKAFDEKPASTETVTGHPMYYDEDTKTLMNVPVEWLTALLQDGIGGTTEITGLPVGTTYSVTEVGLTTITTASNISMHSGALPTPTTQIVTGNQTVEFENTRKTGSLSITKQVVSPIPSERDNNATYSVKVTLKTKHGGQVSAGAVSATLKRKWGINAEYGAAEQIAFTNGVRTIEGIHHDETVLIEGIPTDLTYMVAESGLDASRFDNAIEVKTVNSEQYVDISNTSVSKDIVAGSTPSMVKVTNTRKTGELVITKVVNSTVASDKTTHEYHFEVEILNYGENHVAIDAGTYGDLTFSTTSGDPARSKATFTLTGSSENDAWTKTATGLPIGVTYKVTEMGTGDEATFLNNFDTTWSRKIGGGDATEPIAVDGRAYTGPQNDANTISSDSTTVTCTNTRKKGSLQLSKVVNSPFESERTASYPFTINLRMPAQGNQSVENISATYNATGLQSSDKVTFTDGVATVDVKPGAPVTISGLPVGAEYTVSEETNNSALTYNNALTPGTTAYKVVGASETTNDSRDQHLITANTTYGAEITNTRNQILLTIGKVSALNPSIKLAGARFTLTPDSVANAETTLGWTSKQLVSDADGYLCEAKENGSTTTTKRFRLKPGTYKLTETKAPLGYHALAQPVTFEVTADYSVLYTDSIRGNAEGVVDTTRGMNVEDPTERYVIINVANSTGAELPSTGGPGTAAIYVAGCILLAAAGAAALRRRQ
ncbi:MAG: Cna B-type domain-containing protein [Coriobacteriales bacterium]|nr:Cna B-type domain-containing protein [Coriobacteriales bacterium]